ncbi:MAG: hypothetical protein ACK56F_18620, partial [bacterium]
MELERLAFLRDHAFRRATILPAAAYAEMALAAAAELFGAAPLVHVEDLQILEPLALGETDATRLHVVARRDNADRVELIVSSRHGDVFVRHATATLRREQGAPEGGVAVDPGAVRARCPS